MSDLVQYAVGDSSILIEVPEDDFGVERTRRREDGVIDGHERLEKVLANVRPTARAVADALSGLSPDSYEIEFGIKVSAELGAIVAKSSAESHFTVRVAWKRDHAAPAVVDARPR